MLDQRVWAPDCGHGGGDTTARVNSDGKFEKYRPAKIATNEVSAPDRIGRAEVAMEDMHAKECDTLQGQIDRLQTYAARLVVHNDYLLRLHPLQTVEEAPDTPQKVFSLPEIPPPWHHPEPAPPPEGSLVPEKLELQARVIVAKLAQLKHTSRQSSDTLKDVCQRAAVSAWAPSTFRRLAGEVEPAIRAEGDALVTLSKTTSAMRAEARAGDGDEGDEEARLLVESLRELLCCTACMSAHGAQLVQVGAILEVAAAALGTAAAKMDRDREQLRAARRALTRRMDSFWSPNDNDGDEKTKTAEKTRVRVNTGSKRSRADEYTDEGYASDDDTSP